MNTATYALSALSFVVGLIAFVVLIRVLLDALSLYHAAGLARVRNHTRRTSQ